MGGRPLEGPADETLRITRRPVGSDQGFSAGTRRSCRRHRCRQSIVRRRCLVPLPSGIPWRDLPERFGSWKIVHQRFGRWAESGVFERIFKLLASDHDNEYMMIDATIVRAHQHSAGARKKTATKRSVGYAADWAP